MEELADRVAVVTGGASGIGLALARTFASEGMRVVLGDVEAPALEAAVKELDDGGATVIGVPTDVSDPEQVEALARAAEQEFGAIHIACNNAGVGAGGLSWQAPLETWQWVIGVNLWGVVHGVRTFVPRIIEQDAGHVVNTASVAGLVAAPFMGPYNASKHAVVAISETLHHELGMMAPHVKVSVLCPGWVNTRIGESERNRPSAHAVERSSEESVMQEALRGFLAGGLDPMVVAGRVLDAVRTDRFWVLTHDDDDSWMAAIRARGQSVSDRTNPVFGML
ncbi:MAG TPA: SDR family NAD(P)-dependent oxidoreductase [Acidimicrobiia bacterium]|nr:SDR family NAD(P)-dependent oxidoreductase [Acidimicrobiia bacterium]